MIKAFAKNLRQDQTDAEKLLWRHIRSRRFAAMKFRRQQPVGRFIPDFISFEARIIVELDGGHHAQMEKRDHQRDKWFEEQGFQVLRFWNNEVLTNTEKVLEIIREKLENVSIYSGVSSPKEKPGTGGTERAKTF